MSTRTCVLILALWTLCGSTVVSGLLGSPRNVRLTSYNMNLVLRWQPPEGAADDLLYTTQIISQIGTNSEACVNISALQCDITDLSVRSLVLPFGKYTGRVRAVSGSHSSKWVDSNAITLDEDTVIGPPAVSLLSNGVDIEVSITEPKFSISVFRQVYNSITYTISYWKDGQKELAKKINNTQQNRVVLSHLAPQTKYCVQVQVNADRNPTPGQFSEPVCESTTNEEAGPWVEAVVTFGIMAVIVAMVVLAVVYHKQISHFLCPKDVLPEHIKEYLLTLPNNPIHVADPPKETYSQFIIVPDDRTVEELCPLEATETHCSQPDITVEET